MPSKKEDGFNSISVLLLSKNNLFLVGSRGCFDLSLCFAVV